MVRALLLFLSDDSALHDVRSSDGKQLRTFLVTGQDSGRDDHLFTEAIAKDHRVHIFHRGRAKGDFSYFGQVVAFGQEIPRSVPVGKVAPADQQLRRVLYTEDNPVRVPMIQNPKTRLRFKEAGVDFLRARAVDETNLKICFVAVDMDVQDGGGGGYSTKFFPPGKFEDEIDLADYVRTQKAEEEIKAKKKRKKT